MDNSSNLPLCTWLSLSRQESVLSNVFRIGLNGLLTTLMVLLGTFSNVKSAHLMCRENFARNRGTTLAVSLMALVIWDTVLLWSAFFYYGLHSIVTVFNRFARRSPLLVVIFHPIVQIASTASIWCVVAITAQRYFAGKDPFNTVSIRSNFPSTISGHCRPFDRRPATFWQSASRHLRLPVLLSIGSVIVNIPTFFELFVILCKTDQSVVATDLKISAMRKNRLYYVLYRIVCRMVYNSVIPNLLIVVLTTLTLLDLRRSNRLRRLAFNFSPYIQTRDSFLEQIQTSILLALILKFVLFRSLIAILDVWEGIGYMNTIYTFIHLVDCSNFLIVFNSATNSLLYVSGRRWLVSRVQSREKSTGNDSWYSLVQISLLTSSWRELRRSSFADRLAKKIAENLSTFYIISQRQKVANDLTPDERREIPHLLTNLLDELIDDLHRQMFEETIRQKIRNVGVKHRFSAHFWREFKSDFLTTVSTECQFDNEAEKIRTLAVWTVFLSTVIGEMRRGIILKDENTISGRDLAAITTLE